MFGLDMSIIQQELKKFEKMAEDQRKLTTAVETLNELFPKLITELNRLNVNLETK